MKRLRPLPIALALAASIALVPSVLSATPPPPKPVGPTITPPPAEATATPFPEGTVVSYTGRLIDYEQGFIFFSSGDGFQLAPDVRIVDAATGGPTTLKPGPHVFARATFDKATKMVVEVGLSQKALTGGIALADVKQYAQEASPAEPNPELAPKAGAIPGRQGTGRQIPVTVTVSVPPTTPLTADVYMATDVSNWNPRAIRLDRIDANHYRVRTDFTVGTLLHYKFTRGDWNTAERTATGLDGDPHTLDLRRDSDVVNIDPEVEHWADDNLGAGTAPGPNGLPTPYNPGAVPFQLNGGGGQSPAPPGRHH
jgi:hypothetical protein